MAKEIAKTHAVITGITYRADIINASATLSMRALLADDPEVDLPLSEESFKGLEPDIAKSLMAATEVEIIVRTFDAKSLMAATKVEIIVRTFD